MSRSGESCFRVPIRATGPVTHFEPTGGVHVEGSDARSPSTVRRTKAAIGVWGPIVSAADEDAATAKVLEIYPEAIFERSPEFLHGPGSHHHGEANNLQLSRLARAGFQ